MASIKFGNFVVDARGKINGNVYSKNKGGAYARVRVKPSNPRSSFQSAVRAILTAFSQGWKALTPTQIAGWNQAAINFPKSNRVGDRHIINGNSLYVSLNKNLADVGQSPLTDAPSPESVESMVVDSLVADNSSQSLTLTFTGVVPANTALKVFFSGTVSAGVNSIGTKLRQVLYLPPAAAAIQVVTVPYIARFGAIGAVGSKIFYKVVPVNTLTGQAGAAISGQTTIVA